jgi:ribosome-associated protein
LAKKTDSKEKALQVVKIALGKKAVRPVILDVRDFFNLYDYFVICSAETGRQVKAIADEIEKKCRESGIDIHHREKDESFQWMLIDLFDVVIHVFLEEARDFYNLEYLWRDAKKVKVTLGSKK